MRKRKKSRIVVMQLFKMNGCDEFAQAENLL